MGYLVCDTCGGYYRLREGESPDDFQSRCQCGGNLEYYDDLDGRLNKPRRQKSTSHNSKDQYFIPIMLIMVSLECLLTFLYISSFTVILGIVGLIFAIFLFLIRIKKLETRLYSLTRRIIYFLTAMIFLAQGSFLFMLWSQIDSSIGAKIGILIFTVLSLICGLSMVVKTIKPNTGSRLDPPL